MINEENLDLQENLNTAMRLNLINEVLGVDDFASLITIALLKKR